MFALPDAVRRKQLAGLAERLSRPLGFLLSVLLLVVVLGQARTADWSVLARSARLSAGFWISCGAYYLLSPCAEWLIYSRLWGFDRGTLPALLRKFVSNELLVDYLGDVQFLAWAHARKIRSPFAAVKDVTILSALTGNLVTLVLMILAWPNVVGGLSEASLHAVFGSLGVVIAVSSLILLVGKRIFTHRPGTLMGIGVVLVLRTVGAMSLSAVLWHLLMPGTSLTDLFVLATLRMVVSRLPLVPSKDLLFAGLAVLVFGRAADISVATSMIASLMLIIHVVVGSLLALTHIGSARRRSPAA